MPEDETFLSGSRPPTKTIDRSHPDYGPDPIQMRGPYRDQPRPGEGFWRRLLHSILGD
jgi:hypothetical protein